MSDYYIKAIVLENCIYSNSAITLLKQHNIPSKIINVTYDVKDKYKSNDIQTYPQIYLKKNNKKESLLLGGYDNLLNFIQNFKGKSLNNSKIENFLKNNNEWSRKSLLRFIELINLE